jgi:hypothetical protein
MKKIIIILLFGILLFGCAQKTTAPAQSNTSEDITKTNENESILPITTNDTSSAQTTADDQLDAGMDLFDFTVDPMISESGYDGVIPQ